MNNVGKKNAPDFKIFISGNEILILVDGDIKSYLFTKFMTKEKTQLNYLEKRLGLKFQTPFNSDWGFNGTLHWDKTNHNLIRVPIPLPKRKINEEEEKNIRFIVASLGIVLIAIKKILKSGGYKNSLLLFESFDYDSEKKKTIFDDSGKKIISGKFNLRIKILPDLCKWLKKQSEKTKTTSLLSLIESAEPRTENKIFTSIEKNILSMYGMYIGEISSKKERYVMSIGKELRIYTPNVNSFLEPEIERISSRTDEPYHITSFGVNDPKEQLILLFSLLTICSYVYMDQA